MPHSLGAVPNPRYRTGLAGGQSLQVRAEAARQMVQQIIPASHRLADVANGMTDEFLIDRCHAAVEQYRAERAAMAPEPSPMLRAAWDERSNFRSRYNQAVHELRQAQAWLRGAGNSWKHRLLNDLAADCFVILEPLPTAAEVPNPHEDLREAQAAAKNMRARLEWITALLAQVREAQGFDSLPKGDQALELIRKLIGDRAKLTDRITNLEAAISALTAQLNQRKQKSSKRSATPKKGNIVMTVKHDSPASSGGRGNLRRWSQSSYSAQDGRAVSSLKDEYLRGGPADSADHCVNPNAQIPTAFKGLDAERTQDRTPVRKRPIG
jgi:hypothetical protein